MNTFDLSRNWSDFAYESAEAKPHHAALYYWIIDKANRSGWKEIIDLPTSHSMEVTCIGSYKMYRKCLEDLEEWGFIEVVFWTKNQFKCNKVVLKRFGIKSKALTKALPKQDPKQVQSNDQSEVQSVADIYKHTNHETDKPVNEDLPPNRFEEFWEAYDHKQKRTQAEREWVQAIKRAEPDLIIQKAKEYNRYRTEKDEIPMHPGNWLIANRWHDEYQTKPKTPKRPLSSIPDYRNE